MDKLIEEFRKLLEELKTTDKPELYGKFHDLILKIQDAYKKQFGKVPFGNWIDPIRPPPGAGPKP